MFLAKGLEGFGEEGAAPIAPGQVWSTDNPDASVEAFGGDAESPSEDSHIQQIREAMDKTSAINPLAAGLLRAKVGQLSSENALRITLMGTFAKTARKQAIFSRGLTELAQLILRAFDIAGVYRTDPADRGIRVEWPEPLPRPENQRLESVDQQAESFPIVILSQSNQLDHSNVVHFWLPRCRNCEFDDSQSGNEGKQTVRDAGPPAAESVEADPACQ